MGTEIQPKTYFPGYSSMPDLNNNASSGMWALYYEDKNLNTGQRYDSFLTRQTGDRYFGYEKEQVRQTILKHELIFRHQLQELHRLYRRQRDLMNEFRSKELHKNLVQSPFPQRTFDLELPVDLNIKIEGKQQEERIFGALVPNDKDVNLSHGSSLNSNGYLKRTHKLADLNEPILVEETTVNDLGNTTCLQEHIQNVNVNSNSGFQFFSKEFSQSSPMLRDGGFFPRNSGSQRNEITYSFKAGKTKCEDHNFISAISSGHSATLFKPLQVEPRKAYEPLMFSMSNQSKTDPQRKKRIFGVEISEGNHDRSVGASSTPILYPLNPQSDTIISEVLKGSDCVDLKSSDGQKKHENPMRGPPWLTSKPHCGEEQIKEKENFYHMSLDSLQNYSPQFFNRVEATKGPSRVLVHVSPSPTHAHESDQRKVDIGGDRSSSRNIFGFPIVDMAHMPEALKSNADYTRKDLVHDPESEKLEVKDLVIENGALNNHVSGLRHQVDLNLSLKEEEAPSVPSLPTAILKIATTEIDLEVPCVLECEMDVSPQADSLENQLKTVSEFSFEKSQEAFEEFDRVAAEVLIGISSSVIEEDLPNDCLIWFADIVSSRSESKLGQLLTPMDDACEHDEESIPKGMDYFEFMTLTLKQDSKEEQYFYKPQKEGKKTAPKRPRRGQARRGRQRKDFQRDVLPGLVSLSRHEVREDLEMIEDIFRASGCTWESSLSRRSAAKKGKKRSASRVCTATPAPLSLTGWGRRVPRQRCTTSNHTRGLKCQT